MKRLAIGTVPAFDAVVVTKLADGFRAAIYLTPDGFYCEFNGREREAWNDYSDAVFDPTPTTETMFEQFKCHAAAAAIIAVRDPSNTWFDLETWRSQDELTIVSNRRNPGPVK